MSTLCPRTHKTHEFVSTWPCKWIMKWKISNRVNNICSYPTINIRIIFLRIKLHCSSRIINHFTSRESTRTIQWFKNLKNPFSIKIAQFLIVKKDVSSSWSSSLGFPMRKSDEMTIGKAHPTLDLMFMYLVESIAKFLLIFSWNDNSSSKVYWESIAKDTFDKDSQCLKKKSYRIFFRILCPLYLFSCFFELIPIFVPI